MRDIPPALQAKLETGATTLCRCWILTRRDGAVLGFTDHDRDLDVLGTVCVAAAGFAASEATQAFGMNVGGAEVSGALADESLNEDDLAAGLYDAARVKTYLVDWQEPALHLLLHSGVLGEIRRAGAAFTAEIRGPAHRLAEESGRLYTPRCGADLGDARCGIDLTQPQWRGAGVVVAVQSPASIRVSGLESFAAGWFTAGRLAWTSGANADTSVEVKIHGAGPFGARLDLWQPAAADITIGDAFAVTAGCDKRFATCRERFANAINFRGFPHIPGNDYLISHPTPGEPGHDGESLFG